MERLIKPVEYAQQLGISRQAVYAKIKRGIFHSKSVDGKLYIAIEEEILPVKKSREDVSLQKYDDTASSDIKKVSSAADYEILLKAKDETIGVLIGTVRNLKKSNKQMSATLRGEIDLLKEAFHEMRSIYITQIDHIRHPQSLAMQKPIDVTTVESDPNHWISFKKFFKKHKVTKIKKQELMTKKLKKAYKRGDNRILIQEGQIKLNYQENFEDILS